MRLSIIIPVYNSAAFIERNLHMLDQFLGNFCPESEIISVDDGSTDNSAQVIKSINLARHRAFVLEQNSGKFAALKLGMINSRGSCCIFTDADLPFELESLTYIEQLVNQRGFHVVVGDRSLTESAYEQGVPVTRRIFNWLSREFIRVVVTAGIFDSQCGLKGFRGDVARAIFPLLREGRFAGDVELLYIALKYNLEIKRIPVRIQRVSPSTVRFGAEIPRMLGRILKLRSAWKRGDYNSPVLSQIADQSYWAKGAGQGGPLSE